MLGLLGSSSLAAWDPPYTTNRSSWPRGLTCCSLLLPPSAGGLAAFRAFLKSEYSEENIEFWVSCEEYKKTTLPAQLGPKARKIYDEFISIQATREVGGAPL